MRGAVRATGRRSTFGFTLIEVAVALAILGIGVVTVLEIVSGSLRLQDRASRESRAVLLARGTMDALLFQPDIRDHVEDRPSAEGYRTHIVVRHATPEEGGARDLDFSSDVALRYLQVDVTWQDASGAKTYTVQSLRVAPENE
ncbi:MAG TPA: prepilin-type N-terminal cleavage/methylation domain-containing protein [Candidatus Binatia bacterium]|jgi:prepilin-type N-terminal cleavage/methylation domain-containing protein|nr:prepilin-type N-terminal cleavage/methylation domain-containing protein [Candidatus Binatia bacterium]